MEKCMNRRDFIKGVLVGGGGFFCNTGLFFDSLSYARELDLEKKNDFTIFFMGNYGRRVLNEFRLSRRINPVLNKCKHVAMDVNSESGFFEISNHDTLPLLARSCNTSAACFVIDPIEPGMYTYAEIIAKVIKEAGKATLFALAPGNACGDLSSPFDLFIKTSTCCGDGTASALTALYNTYLGCGLMGNVMCLKLHLPDIISAGEGRAAQFHTITCGISTGHQLDIQDMPRGDFGYTIIELPIMEGGDALNLVDQISCYIDGTVEDTDWDYLFHMNRSTSDIKLTSFVF